MSGTAGPGNGAGRTQPGAGQARVQIAAQIRLAAEKMRHAGDVGHQPVGTVARHHRRIAPRPPPQGGQRRRLAPQIGGPGDEAGADRARIGQRHAALHPLRVGRHVQTVHMIGVP